ncbi:branched-chain amino acid ABC transporter substrate-binding protein [Burkholderia aenigmatica]|uniref:Branched-chain amino acid ABC transporter substrate-binding protein n=1 Tax=Burkholderia aenigmatica TaxID=2015348 RepID=A0ABY6XI40_9BURK|nr:MULTISPECIES: ABC transporter substrate-binding protein [Burkholderia cepacia complex]AYQ39318.1 branched-chain amino acid ABC transporter substrate-binding protein [Burkholderia lata]VWC44141.1 branched-chain amino acid ABC transporter substrate-binding protein [Burkholderia aenigmatica]VWC88583.1 branched-chain amino acid ABC transporter substrate-binding protein [Burkholderia aenigmatica]VWD24071.1 branched-chain amino acid ABC transporter substrate-binding protein [Burkholderia aenigmati
MTLPALPRLPALLRHAAGAALALACVAAQADLKVGVDLSSTGPAAAIGITSKNAILMWPKTIAGQPVQVTVLDDASDPGAAVRNIRKLVDEDHVDVVVGPNITPAALAALDAVATGQTPMITLVGSGAIVEPQEGARTWAFKMAQSDRAMADVMTRYMANHGVKTVGFIGFADSYGDSWLNEFTRFADLRKIRVVATERFNRTDASVTGQALKLIAAKPDAILIAGSGTPAVLPQRTLIERGYKGPIYQTHGIATPEFIKLGGKDVDGTLFPTQPVVVARTLPADHPARKAALAFVDAYEAKYGAGTVTQFAGDAAGVYPRLVDAVGRALKAAQPGTPAFRAALRRELERAHELVVPNGVVNTSDKDHVGLDQRASVMGIVKQGRFVYLSQ